MPDRGTSTASNGFGNDEQKNLAKVKESQEALIAAGYTEFRPGQWGRTNAFTMAKDIADRLVASREEQGGGLGGGLDVRAFDTGATRDTEAGKLELAWAAGLYEGEGSCHLGCEGRKRKDGTRRRYPRIQIGMTDEDVLLRFLSAVGEGTIVGPYDRGKNKPIYRWHASKQPALRVAQALAPYLGTRRRSKFVEVFGADL